ncbi:hypothetical protein AHMF7605_07545 [Adhaeribacter arboris]|uniref:Uncharacterized protein n=1 Tax=Adhaeribacter arboris TaxID=2072846 RepID=A0A2T2YCZ1_9BACT|nr:hypothetical protein [Adhaeribacter arboris]PSR53390.1 hypothetical protein AHMF7605_07545 [Adhaeribacter arboris]
MVVDYLYKIQSLDVNSLQWQDREAFVTVLRYLSRRVRDPHLLDEIKNQMLRLLAKCNTVDKLKPAQ